MTQLPPPYPNSNPNNPTNQYAQWSPNQSFQPPKSSSKKLLFIVLGIIGGSFTIMFLLCIGLVGFAQSQRVDSKETKVLTSIEGLATIEVPKNWISAELNEAASIQSCNKFSECYVIVIIDNKSDLPGYSIDDFAKTCESMVSGALQESSTSSEPNPTTINGLTTRKTVISGTTQGLDVVYWVTYVEGKQHFYQVMTWTLKEKATANKSILENVTKSFIEL